MTSNEAVLLGPGVFELYHHAWRSELTTPSVFFFRTAYGIIDYYLTLGLKYVIIYL